jgi:hypothetical protein
MEKRKQMILSIVLRVRQQWQQKPLDPLFLHQLQYKWDSVKNIEEKEARGKK